MSKTRKQRIAILGGGPAAMTAAFWLTNDPDWDKQRVVTVYQMGWRLGGKCSSGVNLNEHGRTEEHGLHMLGGFYENAFRTIRKTYEECEKLNLLDECPFKQVFNTGINGAVVEGAFEEVRFFSEMDLEDQDCPFWDFDFQSFEFFDNSSRPGDESRFKNYEIPGSPWHYMFRFFRILFDGYNESGVKIPQLEYDAAERLPDFVHKVLSEFSILTFNPITGGTPPETFLQLAHDLAVALHQLDPFAFTTRYGDAMLALLTEVAERTGPRLVPTSGADYQNVRHLAMLINIGASILRGMIADGVATQGIQKIDDIDFSDWLVKHGCWYPNSPLIRAGYQACFAESNSGQRSMAASVALYGLFRMLDYRGAPWYAMKAGTADCVFVPIYLLLRKRGVQFKFFHQVKKPRLSRDAKKVEKNEFNIQTKIKGTYDPLIEVEVDNQKYKAWPNAPRREQFADPQYAKGVNFENPNNRPTKEPPVVLHRGLDSDNGFDCAVLGIPVGALPEICSELSEADPRWKDMFDSIGTAKTQALQIWFKRSAVEMGYHSQSKCTELPKEARACATGYEPPFDTYKDLSELKYRGERQIGHLASLCGRFDLDEAKGPVDHEEAEEIVRTNAKEFLQDKSDVWWPARDKDDIASLHTKANVLPSELYILSLPDTNRFRLHSDDSGFENLFLAGDWTFTDLNVGCFEAATISGMMASRKICGEPQHIYMRLPEVGEPQPESAIKTGVQDLLKLINPQAPSYWWDWQNPEFAEKVYRKSRRGLSLRPEIEGVNLTTFLIGFLNTSSARSLLPPGLELLPPPWTPSGMHPVLYAFGYQQQVRVSGIRLGGLN